METGMWACLLADSAVGERDSGKGLVAVFHQPLERGCLVIKAPLRWDPCVKKPDVFLFFKDLLNPQAPVTYRFVL